MAAFIGNDDLRYPAKELERPAVGPDPGREILRVGGFSVDVPTGSQSRHEDVLPDWYRNPALPAKSLLDGVMADDGSKDFRVGGSMASRWGT